MSLAYLFNSPSSFEGDPGGFARNAAGHALIVGALPVLIWPHLLIATLALYAVWEAAQWYLREAEVWDCLEDFGFVCAGALAVTWPVILLPLGLFYVAGILRRAA